MRKIGNPGVRVFDENVFLYKVRHRSPVSSPNNGGSCTVIRRRFNALDCITSMVRDQEVDGSNPFAPTTSYPGRTKLSKQYLRSVVLLR
jgi:hypothetical protein